MQHCAILLLHASLHANYMQLRIFSCKACGHRFFQILLDKKVICSKEMATGNATDLFLPTLDLLLTKILMGTLCDVVFLFHDKCMQI